MARLIEGQESGLKGDPDYRIMFEPSPRRVRVAFNGAMIADTTKAHLLFETGHLPVYYFPRSDVRADLLMPVDYRTVCPYRGLRRTGRSGLAIAFRRTPCGAI